MNYGWPVVPALPFMAPIAPYHTGIGIGVGLTIIFLALLVIAGGMHKREVSRHPDVRAQARAQIRSAWWPWIPLGFLSLFIGGYSLVIVAAWLGYAVIQAGGVISDSLGVAFGPERGGLSSNSDRFPTEEDRN